MYYSIRYFGEVREHLPQYEGHFLYVLYFDNVIFSPENGVRGWRD